MADLTFTAFGVTPSQGAAHAKLPVIVGNVHHHIALSRWDVRRQELESRLAGLGADAPGLELSIVRVQRPRSQ